MNLDRIKRHLGKYRRFFAEQELFGNLGRFAKRIGVKAVYSVLLLFYAYKRKETPFWAKNIVIGVLGYLLAPLDFMPDLTPIVGYTDDLGILAFGLATIAAYVNEDVRKKARERLKKWFPNYDEGELAEVERQL